ncbi:rhomboid family serine protease [Enhygromyxa salina]|uniref:Rhomboid family serine protease n=1 Tax=Enhygromyxa salina TaxID=215803 RepID=A0A0C2D5W4_9BACT|nr:rhomboid family intramembrane serine protease [Enhygromyxa salina]KIG15437.1 rhomboid family serine protease [Enhygromyxa salina]
MNAPVPTRDQVDAQCPACRLHALVPMLLRRIERDRWAQAEPNEDLGNDEVVQIDACPVCNGAWFDVGELDLLAGEATDLEHALDPSSRPSKRGCPRGCGIMREHDLPGVIRTPVDHCPACKGIWLDGHERHKLAKSTTREGQQDVKKRLARRGAIWAAQLLVQLPVEVENPVNTTPWVVITILVALFGSFALQLMGIVDLGNCAPGLAGLPSGAMFGDLADGATFADLCFAPVAGSLKHQWGRLGFAALSEGSWYTLATHWFLHGGWAHLLGNCYFLYIFGDNVETLFGRLRFALFFLGAAIVGGFAEVLLTQNTIAPIIGASGGIAGVMAAYLWCFPRNKLFQVVLFVQLKLPVWVYLFVWVGFQAVMGVFATSDAGVAWFSHLFGFAFGGGVTPLILWMRRGEVARSVRTPALG